MSELRRLAAALAEQTGRSTEFVHDLLHMAGLRGSVAGADVLLRALARHESEFQLLARSYPACQAWVEVLGASTALSSAIAPMLSRGTNLAEARLELLRAAMSRGMPGQIGAPFTRFICDADSDGPELMRVMRAACYLISVMRQSSHHPAAGVEVSDEAWLDAVEHGAKFLVSRLGPASTSLLSQDDDVLQACLQAITEVPQSGVGSEGIGPAAALTALWKLLRTKGAAAIGGEVREHFRLAALSRSSSSSSTSLGDGNELPYRDQKLRDDEDDTDSYDEEPDDTGEVALATSIRGDAKKQEPGIPAGDSAADERRRWGNRSSAALPEQYLLPEHWWAFDPGEMSAVRSAVESALTEPADLRPGCRPPRVAIFEAFIASVALAMGRTVKGSCRMRVVHQALDDELEVAGCLPEDRYISMWGHAPNSTPWASLGFPTGDRYRPIWATGVEAPLDLPESLTRRLGQLSDGTIDAEVQELLPFVAGGWEARTAAWLKQLTGRSLAASDLALRHALARELFSRTANRALIDLACGGSPRKDRAFNRQVALIHYIHPASSRNASEILAAATSLLSTRPTPRPQLVGPHGFHVSVDSLSDICTELRTAALADARSRREAHGPIVRYTLAMLVVATGHRAVDALFHFPWDLDLRAAVAFICDKLVVGSEARFVPLAKTVVQQMLFYRRHLSALIRELMGDDPELASAIARAAGIAYAGGRNDVMPDGAHPVSQFFLLEGRRLVSLTAVDLDSILLKAASGNPWLEEDMHRASIEPDEPDLLQAAAADRQDRPEAETKEVQGERSVVRLLRRNLATFLWAAGASGAQVEALLGHNRDWHVLGKASNWTVLGNLARLRPLIEQYLEIHGWAPMDSTALDLSDSPLMVVPGPATGGCGYEGREREGRLALVRALTALRDAVSDEATEDDEELFLTDALVDSIRAEAIESLGADRRACAKLTEAFHSLAAGGRQGPTIRITARKLNAIRVEPGPVEIGHARHLAISNAIREEWLRVAAHAIASSSSARSDGERWTRLAVIAGMLVIQDGVLDERQIWPLLESVQAAECSDANGRIQLRAEVQTASARFDRVVYCSRLTSAAIRGLLSMPHESADQPVDRKTVELKLAEMLASILPPPTRKGWTCADLARVFRAWWLIRRPGFLQAIAIGQATGPSADRISEATLQGGAPPRLLRLNIQRTRCTRLPADQVRKEVDEAIKNILSKAAGRYSDGNQGSRSQRRRLRELFEGELQEPLPALMSSHQIVALRVQFIEHLLLVGGLEKEHLAFRSILEYDSRLASLYQACWGRDILQFSAAEFDELYASLVEQHRNAYANRDEKTKARVVAPDQFMTMLRTFHWFLRSHYPVPQCKLVAMSATMRRQSRPRSAVLAPRLIAPVLRGVGRATANDPTLGNATTRFLLTIHAYGVRSKEGLSPKVRDFDLSAEPLRMRVRSNRANKIKNNKRGRRVIPVPLATAEDAQLLRSAIVTEANAVGVDRYVMADVTGEHVLMDPAPITALAMTSLKAESGNAAMVDHSLRHSFATALVCLMTPSPAQVASCSEVRRQLSFGKDVESALGALGPTCDQWPFAIGRAAAWLGAGTETLLGTYFHGASWLMAEYAESVAEDSDVKDLVWAALLRMSRSNLSKIRGNWLTKEGQGADTSWERVVGHYVGQLKLPPANDLPKLPVTGDGDEGETPGASRYTLTFAVADRLLVRMRQNRLTAEQLAVLARDEHGLNAADVERFLRAKAAVVADTSVVDFDPVDESAATTRAGRTGIKRSSVRRQELLARLEVLSYDESLHAGLARLAHEWHQWVDKKRPLLVTRSVERLKENVTLLSYAGVPAAALRLLVSASASLSAVVEESWAASCEVVQTRDARFSRGPKNQTVDEYAIELRQFGETAVVRNEDLHRALVVMAAMLMRT